MSLLTDELRQQLPPLSATEKQDDPIVICKFFTPDSRWTWYVLEFDGEDTFFGLVDGLEVELSYFSLTEPESVRGPMGLAIEGDLYFTPCTLSEVEQRTREQS
jgi:hypothetical protein